MDESEVLLDEGLSYLIGLSIQTDAPGPDGVKSPSGLRRMVLSATVFSYQDVWMLLTAGHVLQQLQELQRSGYRVRIKLVDLWAKNRIDDSLIPYPFDAEQVLAFDNDAIDFGFAFISKNTRSLLEVNGVRSIDEHHWQFEPNDANYDVCGLIGIPETSIEVSSLDSDTARIGLSPAIVRLEHQFDTPTELVKENATVWYGRVEKSVYRSLPASINGMSGGPVFGYRRKDDQTIWFQAIGIQNSTYPCGDYVYFRITPVWIVGELLKEAVRRVTSEVNESPDDDVLKKYAEPT